jgi:hypothetical protein
MQQKWYDGVWGSHHGRFDCCCGVVALEIENTASKYGVKTASKQGRNLRGFMPYFDAVFFGDVDDVTR